MTFQNFFFGKLPVYYKVEDTYKDDDGRGLLERYLEIFGLELDNDVMPKVENYLDIIDPFTTDPKFLNDIAFTLGSPPDLLGDPDKYAKVLAYIISVYKIKGTAQGFQLLFSLLGFNVSVVEYPPTATVLADESNIADDSLLADNGCPCCSDYELVVGPLLNSGNTGGCQPPTFTTVDQTILATFIKIIEFNQPINANLLGIINGGQVCEEVSYCLRSDVTLSVLQASNADNSLLADDNKKADNFQIMSSEVYSENCTGPVIGGIGYMEIEDDFEVS